MNAPTVEPLITAQQIAARVQILGDQIRNDYVGRELVLVVVLKGSFVFAADLARAIAPTGDQSGPDVQVDFLALRSYGDASHSSGVVQITHDLSLSIEGKHVLVVEDIVDTGLTMTYLLENLATRRPASVKVCALLHKPSRQKQVVAMDYLGFTIDDQFVVGYGLDRAQRYRNLPFIGVPRV